MFLGLGGRRSLILATVAGPLVVGALVVCRAGWAQVVCRAGCALDVCRAGRALDVYGAGWLDLDAGIWSMADMTP